MLTVISTSFETKVLDFDTSEGATTPPLALEWCGEDSVVLHWKSMGILMYVCYMRFRIRLLLVISRLTIRLRNAQGRPIRRLVTLSVSTD